VVAAVGESSAGVGKGVGLGSCVVVHAEASVVGE
jgi:hypothetical protein